MEFGAATDSFEQWLRARTRLVEADLAYKHEAMLADVFSFFRATYYRWAQQFASRDSEVAAAVVHAPTVLAVADLHLENFGTWRDALGRLVWGVNDFDEAHPLPYTNDLLRLATSVLLAVETGGLQVGGKAGCRAILEGYREGLLAGGRPFVIGEDPRWFEPILADPPGNPGKFWNKLQALPKEPDRIPAAATRAIESVLPTPLPVYSLRHRQSGLGNLGKMRFTALSEWLGGPIAREAKAVTQSAAAWVHAHGADGAALPVAPADAPAGTAGAFYADLLATTVRSPDPFWRVEGNWVVRRLAPDCRRFGLASVRRAGEAEWLLNAMGFETANLHLGSKGMRAKILKHLDAQPKNWLKRAAQTMESLVQKDFKAARKG